MWNRLGTAVHFKKASCLLYTNAGNSNVCNFSRTITRNLCHTSTRTKSSNFFVKTSRFEQTKRQFSLTTVSSIWVPWGKSEPPAIPSDAPSAPAAPVDTIVPQEVVPTVDATTFPDSAAPLTDALTGAIIDPPFIELGLASSWWPNHFVHQIMELVHLNSGLAWWSTIVIGTLFIRVTTIPLYIYTRKYMINQTNHNEEMQKLVADVQKYKYQDNMLRSHMAKQKLKEFYKKTGTGPVKGIFVNSAMAALFMTCVSAVRQMCNVPVPSLVEGGALWFTDLASADPYYILPILNGIAVSLIIRTSMRGGMLQGRWLGFVRKAQYAPIVLIPLVFGNWSTGIYLYMLTTSSFSLAFQNLLLVPGVKERLKFPIPKRVEPSERKTARTYFKDWKEDSFKQAAIKTQHQNIKRARKQRAKSEKKALKGDPPVTYTIGVDAIPVKQEKPDFEQEWKPPRPKHFGLY